MTRTAALASLAVASLVIVLAYCCGNPKSISGTEHPRTRESLPGIVVSPQSDHAQSSASDRPRRPDGDHPEQVPMPDNTKIRSEWDELIARIESLGCDPAERPTDLSLPVSPFQLRAEIVDPLVARGAVVLPALHSILEQPGGRDVAVYHTCCVIAQFRDPTSRASLQHFLQRELESVRLGKYHFREAPIQGAIRALSEIPDEDGDADLFRRFLDCDSPGIILEAAEAMLATGHEESDVLRALARAEDLPGWEASDRVRLESLAAEFLAGRYPNMPPSWRTWIRRHMDGYAVGSFRLLRRTYRW